MNFNSTQLRPNKAAQISIDEESHNELDETITYDNYGDILEAKN